MTVLELTQLTHWTMLNAGVLESTIEGIYTGDLLSYVMGNGEPKTSVDHHADPSECHRHLFVEGVFSPDHRGWEYLG